MPGIHSYSKVDIPKEKIQEDSRNVNQTTATIGKNQKHDTEINTHNCQETRTN